MCGLNACYLKFVDLKLLKQYRDRGLVVYCQIGAWNETEGNSTDVLSAALKNRREHVSLIKNGLAGDIFWHWFEQDEPLMDGFTQTTGRTFATIHFAADKTLYYREPDERFDCDVCYVGSYLPMKRPFLKKHVLPLREKYDLRIYGSDWTFGNRILGNVQKVGQYFNINPLKKVRSLKLTLADERKLYSSARISLNVHEEQVKIRNCEINERTFKILACGGFQVCDNVPLLRKFFGTDELVIAKNIADWFEKIDYFVRNPEKRGLYIEAAHRKVLADHTYHNRVAQLLQPHAARR
jgi:spore maturation protein CgeB